MFNIFNVILASKLDHFSDVLFDQLNLKGMSYRAVCQNLLTLGVEISPQALRSWHLRRARKIAFRGSLLTLSCVSDEQPDMTVIDHVTVVPGAIRKLNDPGVVNSLSSVHVTADAALQPIRDRILEEERNLLSHSSSSPGYLIRKKQ